MKNAGPAAQQTSREWAPRRALRHRLSAGQRTPRKSLCTGPRPTSPRPVDIFPVAAGLLVSTQDETRINANQSRDP